MKPRQVTGTSYLGLRRDYPNVMCIQLIRGIYYGLVWDEE